MTVIRYKGEFSYEELYALMKNFFAKNDYELVESVYKDKGGEVELAWNAWREYDEFHKVEFEISLVILDIQRIQVARDGREVTLFKARTEITIEHSLVRDYGEKAIFDTKTKLGSFLKGLHEKITSREVDEYWDEIQFGLAADLSSEIKSFFAMQDSG